MSSKWVPYDSWEGCCKLPETYPQHMKIRQGPTPPADFHTISKHFIQNIYKSSIMKVFQWLFKSWILWTSNRLGRSQIYVNATIWLEDCFGSFLGWDHTVLIMEKNLSVYSLQWDTTGFLRNFQQFHHLHSLCIHGYFLLTNRKFSTMRHKMNSGRVYRVSEFQ